MNKTKWIIGLSIAGVLALSGTVFAMNSGANTSIPVGQNAISANTVNQTPNLGTGTGTDPKGSSVVNNNLATASQSISTSPSSSDSSPNNAITPGSNRFAGGYDMRGYRTYGNGGGYGADGNSGGYGMMGSYGANGNAGGYGMMGGYGANGNGGGYGMMGGYSTNSNGNK